MQPGVPYLALASQTLGQAADASTVIQCASIGGFQAVELSGDLLGPEVVPLVKDQLSEFAIDVLGIGPSSRLLSWHARWDTSTLKQFEKECARASELGARYIVLPLMRNAGGAKSVEAGLRAAIPAARDHGIRLAFEPIGHYPLLRRIDEAVLFLRHLDSIDVGLLLDSFHFFRANNTLDDLYALDGVRIEAIQISNANGRPLEQLLGYRDRTFPLDGPFPVLELVRHVMKRHPGIPVSVEVIGDTTSRLTPAEATELAYLQARKIVSSSEVMH